MSCGCYICINATVTMPGAAGSPGVNDVVHPDVLAAAALRDELGHARGAQRAIRVAVQLPHCVVGQHLHSEKRTSTKWMHNGQATDTKEV